MEIQLVGEMEKGRAEKKKMTKIFAYTNYKGPLRGSLSLCGALSLSRRGLSPVKLAYNPSRPDGRLR